MSLLHSINQIQQSIENSLDTAILNVLRKAKKPMSGAAIGKKIGVKRQCDVASELAHLTGKRLIVCVGSNKTLPRRAGAAQKAAASLYQLVEKGATR